MSSDAVFFGGGSFLSEFASGSAVVALFPLARYLLLCKSCVTESTKLKHMLHQSLFVKENKSQHVSKGSDTSKNKHAVDVRFKSNSIALS